MISSIFDNLVGKPPLLTFIVNLSCSPTPTPEFFFYWSPPLTLLYTVPKPLHSFDISTFVLYHSVYHSVIPQCYTTSQHMPTPSSARIEKHRRRAPTNTPLS
jgi:hypothetical protein